VRRAFLCGVDAFSGRSFEHRQQWVEDRLLELASIFAVGLYGFAVMSNHFHVVLRLDSSAAHAWSDDDVALRWVRLFPTGDEDADAIKIIALRASPERIALCRARLGNLSWFMRCINEPIARRANREDGCKGRFWEGRFKCQALLDDRAVVAAMAYVDLNPIRAGISTRLDESPHTSIARRLDHARSDPSTIDSPLRDLAGSHSHALSLSAAAYIELVDWTGRQLRPDKRGSIPPAEPPALDRLQLDAARWTKHFRGIGSSYWRAIGSTQDLIDKARAMGQQWLKGICAARALDSG
jgi:hypothetical protein